MTHDELVEAIRDAIPRGTPDLDALRALAEALDFIARYGDLGD